MGMMGWVAAKINKKKSRIFPTICFYTRPDRDQPAMAARHRLVMRRGSLEGNKYPMLAFSSVRIQAGVMHHGHVSARPDRDQADLWQPNYDFQLENRAVSGVKKWRRETKQVQDRMAARKRRQEDEAETKQETGAGRFQKEANSMAKVAHVDVPAKDPRIVKIVPFQSQGSFRNAKVVEVQILSTSAGASAAPAVRPVRVNAALSSVKNTVVSVGAASASSQLTTTQRDKLSRFESICNMKGSMKTTHLLEAFEWNIERALEAYYSASCDIEAAMARAVEPAPGTGPI